MVSNGTRAAIYVRISRDKEGAGLGVARQEAACRKLAAQLGWTVGDVYSDNSISAYDRRKRRPQYERMLADVAAGRVDAVLCYAVDRLTRHPIELERLVEILASHRTQVRTVVGGELDLSTGEGLLRARITGTVARFESDRKSERLKAKAAQTAAEGRRPCGGPRPFGYDRHYDHPDSPNRKITGETVNEIEAAAIRDAADRLLRGESMRSIIADWNNRGLRTSLGNRWKLTPFRQMITAPRLAGLIVHGGRVVEGVTAQWPAIVDRQTHEQLAALLLARSGVGGSGGGNARKYWLTGSVFCTCGAAMESGVRGAGGRIYRCPPKAEGGCGSRVVALEELERFMRRLVITRLKDPRLLRDLASREDTAKVDARLLVQAIEQDERRLPMLEDQLTDGDPREIPEIRGAIRRVRARIAENRDRLAHAVGAEPLVGLNATDIEERWDRLDVSQRSALLGVVRVARVVIQPTALRGRFDPGRVELVAL